MFGTAAPAWFKPIALAPTSRSNPHLVVGVMFCG